MSFATGNGDVDENILRRLLQNVAREKMIGSI